MTVGRPDFPTLELRQGGEQVVLGAQAGELVGAQVAGEGLHHGEPPGTRQGGEVVTAGQFRHLREGMLLEEVAPGVGGLEGAQDTEDGEGKIIQREALASDARRFEDNSRAARRRRR